MKSLFAQKETKSKKDDDRFQPCCEEGTQGSAAKTAQFTRSFPVHSCAGAQKLRGKFLTFHNDGRHESSSFLLFWVGESSPKQGQYSRKENLCQLFFRFMSSLPFGARGPSGRWLHLLGVGGPLGLGFLPLAGLAQLDTHLWA